MTVAVPAGIILRPRAHGAQHKHPSLLEEDDASPEDDARAQLHRGLQAVADDLKADYVNQYGNASALSGTRDSRRGGGSAGMYD